VNVLPVDIATIYNEVILNVSVGVNILVRCWNCWYFVL